MNKLLHLDQSQLREALRGEPLRRNALLVDHLRGCARCRRNLGQSALDTGLFAPQDDGNPSQHVTGRQLDTTHRLAFEEEAPGNDQDVTHFVAALQHVCRCVHCFACFIELHQKLSLSTESRDRAVAAFAEGASLRAGQLHIARSLHLLIQQFRPIRASAEGGGEGNAPELTTPLTQPVLSFPSTSFESTRPGKELPVSTPSAAEAYELAQRLAAALTRQSNEVRQLQKAIRDASFHESREESFDPGNLYGSFKALESSMADQHRVFQSLGPSMERFDGAMQRLRLARQEFREKAYLSEPIGIQVGRVILEIVTAWKGDSGSLRLTARGQGHGQPIEGINLTILSRNGPVSPSHHATQTDTDGAADLPIDRTATQLKIADPSQPTPWLVDLWITESVPSDNAQG